MRKVSKEEFYEAINSGRLNVSPTIVTDTYPYTSEWKYLDYSRYGQIFGKSVGVGMGKYEYYVA